MAEPMAEPGAAQDQEQISPEALSKLQAKHRKLLLRRNCKDDTSPRQVLDRLFIGSVGCALNAEKLKENGVTHSLLIAIGVKQQALQAKVPDVAHEVVQVRDATDAAVEFLEALPACLDFIDKALSTDNGSCLVCSFRGMSRAFAVLCSHLMYRQDMTLAEANAVLARARSTVAPNLGFARALVTLEKQLRFPDEDKGETPVSVEGDNEVDAANRAEETVSGAKASIDINHAISLTLSSLSDEQLTSLPLGTDGAEQVPLSMGLDELSAQALTTECMALQGEIGDPEPATPVTKPQARAAQASGPQQFHIGSPHGCPPDGSSLAAPTSGDHEVEAMMEELQQLAQAKEQAVAEEDYAKAAQIRDRMQKLEQEKNEAAQAQQAARNRMGAQRTRLEATRQSLVAQKAKAVQEEDYELAGQINDQLKLVQKKLEEFGSVGSAEPAQHLAAQQMSAQQSQLLEGLQAAAQPEAPREDLEKKKMNGERMAKLIAALEQLKKEEKERPPPQAKSLTLMQKCILYPIVLVLVLLALMAMNAVLLRGVLYIFTEDGVGGGGDEN